MMTIPAAAFVCFDPLSVCRGIAITCTNRRRPEPSKNGRPGAQTPYSNGNTMSIVAQPFGVLGSHFTHTRFPPRAWVLEEWIWHSKTAPAEIL